MGAVESRHFEMGTAVAIGELFDEGLLGGGEKAASIARDYLASFGVRSVADVDALGITGPYRRDFAGLFGVECMQAS